MRSSPRTPSPKNGRSHVRRLSLCVRAQILTRMACFQRSVIATILILSTIYARACLPSLSVARKYLKPNQTTSHQRRLSLSIAVRWLIFTPFSSGVAPPAASVCVPWINNTNLPVEIPEHYSHLGSGFSQPWTYEKHDKALSLTVFKLMWPNRVLLSLTSSTFVYPSLNVMVNFHDPAVIAKNFCTLIFELDRAAQTV